MLHYSVKCCMFMKPEDDNIDTSIDIHILQNYSKRSCKCYKLEALETSLRLLNPYFFISLE